MSTSQWLPSASLSASRRRKQRTKQVSFQTALSKAEHLLELLDESRAVQRQLPHTVEHCQMIIEQLPQSVDVPATSSEDSQPSPAELYLQAVAANMEATLDKCADNVSKMSLKDGKWRLELLNRAELYELLLLRQLNELKNMVNCKDNPTLLISDPLAREFWKDNFGAGCLSVDWSTFYTCLSDHAQLGQSEASTLEPTIGPILDFCFDMNVSAYEFSIFVLLFGPFKDAVANLRRVVAHGSFFAFMTWERAEVLLTAKPEGTYILRFSRSSPGAWAIDVMQRHGHIRHVLHAREASSSDFVLDAIERHTEVYTYPYRGSLDDQSSHEQLAATAAAHNPYHAARDDDADDDADVASSDPSASFEDSICDICLSRLKSTKLLPCQHDTCSACASAWLQENLTCPFCRGEVKGLIDIDRVGLSEERRAHNLVAEQDDQSVLTVDFDAETTASDIQAGDVDTPADTVLDVRDHALPQRLYMATHFDGTAPFTAQDLVPAEAPAKASSTASSNPQADPEPSTQIQPSSFLNHTRRVSHSLHQPVLDDDSSDDEP